MRYLIYCASWEKGEAKFDEIISELKTKAKLDLNVVKKARGSFATDIDGNSWRVVYAYEGARGYKWHVCWVDEEISLRVFNTIIRPAEISQFMSVAQERQVYFY